MITMRSTFLRLPTPQTSKVLQPNYTSTPLPTPRMLPRIPEPGRSSCPAPGACSLEHVLVWVWPGWFMSPAVPRFQHQASLISAQLLAANDSTSGQEASGQWSLALCPRWGPRDPRPGGLASSPGTDREAGHPQGPSPSAAGGRVQVAQWTYRLGSL